MTDADRERMEAELRRVNQQSERERQVRGG